MRAVLFDCDGTLADSFATILSVMNGAFRVSRLVPPSDGAVRAIIGLSLDEAMRHLHPGGTAGEHVALVDAYRAAFRRTRQADAHREGLFPGIEPLLHDLASRPDVLLGLVTGKSRRGVDAILAANGLTGIFQAIRTADDCPSKPHPAMVAECCGELGLGSDAAIVVGDSIYDMAMAKAAGAAGLGVCWGSHRPHELLAHGAFAVADSVDDLAGRLDGWLARPSARAEREAI